VQPVVIHLHSEHRLERSALGWRLVRNG